MPVVNTMFSAVSNVTFNRPTSGGAMLPFMTDMHDTMRRLYQSADALKQLSGQTDVARALNMSPQRLNNWERRGISQAGANAAQALLGINSTWLLYGSGNMSAGEQPALQPASQPARIDPDKLALAIAALRRVAERNGYEYDPQTHPVETVAAYELAFLMDEADRAAAVDFGGQVVELFQHRGKDATGGSTEAVTPHRGRDDAKAG